MHKIFIVEDDDNIRDMLIYALSSAGFEAEGFACGETFLQRAKQCMPSLALLDIMLPGEDGIAILKKLRASHKFINLPAIMLTAKGTEYDRIKGLDLGADDYITKPFSVLEVISRVRAVLRRSANTSAVSSILKVGEVELNPDRRSVAVGKAEIHLTFKEFELLSCLLLNKDIVLTRDRLLEEIWGFDFGGESRTVDMHIRSLRQKLGSGADIIKTVRHVGYKVEE